MIRVVRIEPYKNRNKVVLDNGEKFLLYKGDIRKFKLEINQEISKVTYNEIKQLLYERGKERALYILHLQAVLLLPAVFRQCYRNL